MLHSIAKCYVPIIYLLFDSWDNFKVLAKSGLTCSVHAGCERWIYAYICTQRVIGTGLQKSGDFKQVWTESVWI